MENVFNIRHYGKCENLVFDDEIEKERPVTETEKKIIEFCFTDSHQYNRACSNLCFAVYENTPFHTNDLHAAAKTIFGKWHKKEKKTKAVEAMLPNLRADGSYVN